MPLVVVGLNHKTAPIGLLERLAIAEEDLPKALHQLGTYEHVLEGAILSTCNRVEAYALVSKFHGGAQDLRNFLSEFCHVAPEDISDHLYTYHDEAAVRHLFRVAAGIDSMVVGESEILGQVRRAFQVATAEGAAERTLGHAFRRALSVGKRARTETRIGTNPVSVSSAAVELARRAYAARSLAGKRVLIVGAGKMGRLAARALVRAGVEDVTVVNRSEDRAEDLATTFGAVARGWDELSDALADADIVISSTTAVYPVIDRPLMQAALDRRVSDTPLFVVDIAVPRDVDSSCGDLPGVVLRDIDDLRGVVDVNVGGRLKEVSKVERIIAAEVERFAEWQRARDADPAVSALIVKAEEIRQAELRRLRSSLAPDQESAVDHATKRMVAKLLHAPLNKVKELSSSKQGHLYVSALRELFELNDEPDS